MSKIPLRLFSKLYLMMAMSTLLLISLVIIISDYIQSELSIIEPVHQQTLNAYAIRASDIYARSENKAQRAEQLQALVDEIQLKENTWAAIMRTESQWLAGGYDEEVFWGQKDLGTGRSMLLPIHLYYDFNPVLKIPMAGTHYFLMVQLPQHMRPGKYWREINHAIKYALPVLMVGIFTLLIYWHIISPLRQLQSANQRFSQGEYDVRTERTLSQRKDEIGELGQSFDNMAERISLLMRYQRQLIQDISHELRTPITRIKLALAGAQQDPVMLRVEQEVNGMQSLLEDTLTLSWLNNEKFNPQAQRELATETLDACLLIEAIAEDARFEFPNHKLLLDLPEQCLLYNSNHRALGQSVENIIRNAMKYSPLNSKVQVRLIQRETDVRIQISDQGPGVEPEYLESIFEPFFRVDQSRNKDKVSGYGLGLALCKRQIQALGGEVNAWLNNPQASCAAEGQGLMFEIILPR